MEAIFLHVTVVSKVIEKEQSMFMNYKNIL